MHNTLTDRQERFIAEYLIDHNASAAAARAGYTAKNMAAQGNELMNHPEIRYRIRCGMQDLLASLRASALEIMKQRVRAAFFDPAKLLRGWDPVPLDELDEDTLAVLDIKTVYRKSGPVVTVKQPDRHRALCALEKAFDKLNMLNERHYARMEKLGLVKSLEEIDAMDAMYAEEENPQKPQDLSGPVLEPELAGQQKPEKTMVLSGFGPEPAMPPVENPRKPGEMSGRRREQEALMAA